MSCTGTGTLSKTDLGPLWLCTPGGPSTLTEMVSCHSDLLPLLGQFGPKQSALFSILGFPNLKGNPLPSSPYPHAHRLPLALCPGDRTQVQAFWFSLLFSPHTIPISGDEETEDVSLIFLFYTWM